MIDDITDVPLPVKTGEFLEVYNMDDWVEWKANLPDQEWLLEGMVPAEAAVLMSGKAKKSFKTWLALQMAMCIASGKSFKGLKPMNPEGIGVLVIEVEGPAKPTAERLCMLAMGSKISLADTKGRLFIQHMKNFLIDDPVAMKELLDFMKANNIGLVILDTLAKVQRGDENSSQDMAEFGRCIDKIRKTTGASVMYIHHLRKSNPNAKGEEDIDEEIRGSSSLSGFYDCHLALRKRREEDDEIIMTRRYSEDKELKYRIHWDIVSKCTAVLNMEPYDPKAFSERELNECLMALAPKEGYGEDKLCLMWGGLSKPDMIRIRTELVNREQMEKVGRGYGLSGYA